MFDDKQLAKALRLWHVCCGCSVASGAPICRLCKQLDHPVSGARACDCTLEGWEQRPLPQQVVLKLQGPDTPPEFTKNLTCPFFTDLHLFHSGSVPRKLVQSWTCNIQAKGPKAVRRFVWRPCSKSGNQVACQVELRCDRWWSEAMGTKTS